MRTDEASLDRNVRFNAICSYLIKGASILVGLLAVPAYMRYFRSSEALGTWYTIQTILQWILVFDLGIGNGLRNRLAAALVSNKKDEICSYVSSAYRLLGCVCALLVLIAAFAASVVPWNLVFNISEETISADALKTCMSIVMCGVVVQMLFQLINGILYALQQSFVVSGLALVSNTLILMFISLSSTGSDEANLVSLAVVNVVCMVLPLIITTVVVFKRRLLGCDVDFRQFNFTHAKESLSTGLVILFLQLTWVVVASTHSFLISAFRSPSEVVEFQVYYKIYYTLSSLAAIALVPIWSAVSVAKAEHRYHWIIKNYFKCLLLAGLVALVCLVTAPFVQFGFDIWLGSNSFDVNMSYIFIMSVFATMFVLQNVNASIGNGLSFFRVQVVCMGLAAVAMVPLASVFCRLTNSWIGVVSATIVSILPFQLIEPFACIRYLKKCEERFDNTK